MAYTIFKHIHMLTAYLTVTLFALRLLMDAVGRPGWRQTPLRWIPHANDTLLLVAAIGLVAVTPWMPFVHGWLTLKVVLLVGYIVAGVFAMKQTLGVPVRSVAAILALLQIGFIFHLAMTKSIPF